MKAARNRHQSSGWNTWINRSTRLGSTFLLPGLSVKIGCRLGAAAANQDYRLVL